MSSLRSGTANQDLCFEGSVPCAEDAKGYVTWHTYRINQIHDIVRRFAGKVLMQDETNMETQAMAERLTLPCKLTGVPQRTRLSYENMTPNT